MARNFTLNNKIYNITMPIDGKSDELISVNKRFIEYLVFDSGVLLSIRSNAQ